MPDADLTEDPRQLIALRGSFKRGAAWDLRAANSSRRGLDAQFAPSDPKARVPKRRESWCQLSCQNSLCRRYLVIS
jgi:hypothetical protein